MLSAALMKNSTNDTGYAFSCADEELCQWHWLCFQLRWWRTLPMTLVMLSAAQMKNSGYLFASDTSYAFSCTDEELCQWHWLCFQLRWWRTLVACLLTTLVRTERRLSCPTCTGWVFTMLSSPPTMPAPSPRSVHCGCAPPPPPPSVTSQFAWSCIFSGSLRSLHMMPASSPRSAHMTSASYKGQITQCSHNISSSRSVYIMFTQYIFTKVSSYHAYIFPKVSLHNVHTIYLHQGQFTPCLYLPQGQFTQFSHRISSPGSVHTMLISSTRSVHTKYHHQGQFTQCL